MDFIIKRKTLISMLFTGMSLLGYVSYQQLPVELYPSAQLPTLIVQVNSVLDVDPSYMENQAVIPVEGAVGTLEDVEKIESTVTSRNGMVMIYYSQNANLKYSYLKLQEKVNLLSKTLPEEFIINIIRIDMEQINSQFMDLQVRGAGGIDRIRDIAERDIKPELENIDGIAGVEVFGGRESSVEIRLDEEACKANGITMNRVRSLLASNSSDKVFAGPVYEADRRFFVNISAEYTDVSDIANIIISREGSLLLKDIADIFFGVKEEESYSRVNGLDAVTINLAYDNQANIINLSHKTIDVIDELNRRMASAGVEIIVQNNNAEIMEKNIDQIINLALVGGLLAVIILWFFLKNIRLVFIIAFSIPVSVYTAFNLFYAAGITVNSLTLVGMALAIGMLIDNSVVVLENIYRLAGRGTGTDEAVKRGTKEVYRSVIAATLTTITVFLPFVFSDNFMVRIIGKNIGVSIVSTLLVSLAVALLLIPMATHYLLTWSKNSQAQVFKKLSLHDRLIQSYLLILKASMRRPATVIIGTLAVFFAALLTGLGLSINKLEEIETASFPVSIVMPAGSTLEKTDALVTELEKRLDNLPEKGDIISKIEEDQASLTVNLKDKWDDESDRKLSEIKNDIYERVNDLGGADISMEEASSAGGMGGRGAGGSGGANPGESFTRLLGIGTQYESIIIKGQDFRKMRDLAGDLEYYMEDLNTIRSVSINVQDNTPEVQLNFDTELMSRNNISLNNIAAELSSFQPEYSSGLTFRQGIDEYDIIIKYDREEDEEEEYKNIDDLKQLQISGSGGNIVEMEEIAAIVFSYGMGSIHRENQEKSITLTYRFNDEINSSKTLLESAREEIDMLISGISIPSGIAVEVIHEEDDLKDFYYLIGIAFILIFMILAAVFESLSTPLVLMLSIPLAALGSLIALILTGNSLLNANTLTGFLILLGVVVNNGIILIDYSNILRKRGYRRSRALITAGLARVRPILITAITTIVALLPLAMGKSEYASAIGASFAITVIGGLALSTMLTLVFIPTFYTGLENSLSWIRSQNWKIKTVMLTVFVLLVIMIYLNINRFMWQMITTILAIILVPAVTWFVRTSLRKARETVIAEGEPVRIVIRSLVKIYERDPRIVREWKAARRIRIHSGMEKEPTSLRDLDGLIWQIPLLGFLLYFTYIYLEKNFWVFFFSIISWLMMLMVWKPVSSVLKKKSDVHKMIRRSMNITVFWLVPLFNLLIFEFKWENTAAVIITGFFWYAGLIIWTTGRRLQDNETDIYRLKGRFRNARKTYYKLVLATPLIGSHRKPFKALGGVSMEIGNGMFGLLGPNGAGKTTLMRIICGILDQSYGKIWINGLDVAEKREELQGLIGYLPQEFGTYENMTAREFLQHQAILKNITETETRNSRVEYVLRAVHMYERRNEKISSYSGGMKQRIGIAQILLHLPRILVVDEPTAGLDPRERIRFRNLLVELSRERVVIFSTHIIEDISSSCNKVAVLDRGCLKYFGDPAEMTREAEGRVWQFNVPASEFRKVAAEHLVVHHMSERGSVRIRCIAGDKPHGNAVEVNPNLEDSYLWLLRKSKMKRT